MKKALVVGIDNYPACSLSGCVNDATSIASVLERNGDGSPNFSVQLLTDPGTDISKSNLKGAITDLFAGDSDIALLYFSGHGIMSATGGYIVTPDFQKYDEGISMDEILVLANNSNCRDKVILFDCCHSGAMGSPAISNSSYTQIAEGLTVLTASRDTESAIEVNGKGLFTSLVIDALQGGASDLRGCVTPGGIYSYVDRALGPWDQRPVFKTNVTRFTSLRNLAPPIPLETLREITNYFPSPADEFQLDPSYEFTDETMIQEHVNIFKNLQKFESVGLVVPVDAEHMYYAAMNSKSCKLTAMGYQYWRLVREKKV